MKLCSLQSAASLHLTMQGGASGGQGDPHGTRVLPGGWVCHSPVGTQACPEEEEEEEGRWGS